MKKILLFILLESISICLLVVGFWVYNNSMSFDGYHQTIITIESGNPLNDSLKLNSDTTPEVYKGRKVTWIIDQSSNVDSFRIQRKPKSKRIFLFSPSSEYNKEASGTVSPRYLVANGKLFNYNIYWKMKGDTTVRKFDPKLSVKPNPGLVFRDLLIFIGFCIMFLLPFSVFRNAKKVPVK